MTKFVLEQRLLAQVLGGMQPICARRTPLEVTEYILFQLTPRELILRATDQEISLQVSMMLDGVDTEDMRFLVSGRRIFELVKELDGAISFTYSKNQLKLGAGGADFALNIRSSDDFPPFPERIENLMHISSTQLVSLLNKVAFIIPQSNANNALNGALLEVGPQGISFVATDGHCLARVESDACSLPTERKWLIPKRAVLEVKKLLEGSDEQPVFLGVCGNQLVFSGTNFNFFTKLIADPFPEYRAVLAREGFTAARISRSEFLKTLKRTNCFLAGQFISTRFRFSPGALEVSLENKDVGRLDEALSMENYAGEVVESRFYSPYLLNGLSVLGERELSLHVKSASKPLVFESEQPGCHFIYLVMPVSAVSAS